MPAANKSDCCVGTHTGLSYNDGGTCTECVGKCTRNHVLCNTWMQVTHTSS